MEQPNILVIMVDQMTAGVISALGHPAADTPNLDLLVAESVSFDNCYCNSPICVPSRASFMTGNLPRRTGVFDNGSELPATVPTLAHHLVRAGYTTILSGKMHFVGPDQLHGFQERLTGDISLSGLTLTPDWSRGAYPNEGSSVKRLKEPRVVDWTLQLAFDEEVLTNTLARLRKLRQEGDRFFLCASFSHPHDPFRITAEHWERYAGVSIPPPRAAARPFAQMHPYDQWIQVHHEADRFPLDEHEVEANRRAYLAMVSYVDDHVGRLLREVERLGLDDTLIVFTSDHGEMLGEHGMWFKRTYFDAASKVPLLLRLPNRRQGQRRREVVSLVDLTATLLDIARVPEKEEWLSRLDGNSLAPLLCDRVPGSDGPATWKDSAICEYYAEGSVEPMLFLREGRFKYVFINDQAPLLFDLEADPAELENLADRPEYAERCRVMEADLLAGLNGAELREEIVLSQRERLAIVEATADHFAWSYRPRRDALKLYGRAQR